MVLCKLYIYSCCSLEVLLTTHLHLSIMLIQVMHDVQSGDAASSCCMVQCSLALHVKQMHFSHMFQERRDYASMCDLEKSMVNPCFRSA